MTPVHVEVERSIRNVVAHKLMNYYLTCINPDQNKYRFSCMTVQYGLFGNMYLIRHWGRIGTKGRKLMQSFDTMDEICQEIQRLLEIRKRRGYNLRENTCNVCKKKIAKPAKQLHIDGSEIEVCPMCCERVILFQ